VFWPIVEGDWNSHTSYHASGRLHHKSHNKSVMVQWRPKPDAAFSGPGEILTTPIYLSGARTLNPLCRKDKYTGVFEVDAAEISPTMHPCRTAVAIDLVSPGAPPLVTPPSAVLRRMVFSDAMPNVSVTLWDQLMMFETYSRADG